MKKNKKILSIINGSYIHSSRWIDTYHKRDWDQIVYLPEYKYIGKLIPKDRLIYSKHTDSNNFFVNNKFLRYLLWARELKKIMKLYKPDIIHVQVEEYGIIPYLANVKVPVVFSLMGAGLYVGIHTYWLKKVLFERAAKFSSYITLDTYRMQNKLYEMIEREKLPEVKRVMWGVKLNNWFKNPKNIREKLNISKDRFVILSIRNFIDENYNITKIIDSIPYVIEKIPNAFFIFIGRDSYTEIENYAKEKGYEEYFYFKGLVLEEEYVNTVYSSNVVVSVPTWDSVSTSVLESLYLEKPVVVGKNILDLKEWIEDKKEAIFVERNGLSIAEGIIEIKNNYGIYKDNLSKWKEKNSDLIDYDKNFEEIEQIINSLI